MEVKAQKSVPVSGDLFEDTMDGYFPFRESVRQMMARNGFAAAWISLAHAPMMDLPDVAADAPVPLRLRPEAAGTIRSMALIAVASEYYATLEERLDREAQRRAASRSRSL